MSHSYSKPLAEFVQWVTEHLGGDEKGEAQIFLDRLFSALGLGGVKEAGGSLEYRVKRRGPRGVRTGFADYVLKPVVLIEMKKRGEKLRKHQPQAFHYWAHLTPNRPRWVILCNFDEFWVYDFETQIDEPMDIIRLVDLPDRIGPIAFLLPNRPEPKFRHDLEAVTRNAAELLVDLFLELVHRGIERPVAQRFVLQCMVALFAEDIGLLPEFFFANLLDECTSEARTYDAIGGLFRAMNDPKGVPGGRFKGVRYFNGGLFAEPMALELRATEVEQLREAARFKWDRVRPEIFGTILEASMGDLDRRASGSHFTRAADIMKIVGPTLVEPWSKAIESATTLKRLHWLHQRMRTLQVLDPACGSGNFLYVAYRELKRLEARLLGKLDAQSKRSISAQMRLGFVSARQFYGLDTDPFAVELAKVTMMIARKMSIEELGLAEEDLPLDNLDANFEAVDALVVDGSRTDWPRADVIIGNPPFHGAKYMKREIGADVADITRALYPEVGGMADYCVFWIWKAHNHLPVATQADPFVGRAGLVGTQNIRFGKSRAGGLDHVVLGGTILDAVKNQPWSGDAKVNVSLVNWIKSVDPKLTAGKKKLWSKEIGVRRPPGERSKLVRLVAEEVETISAALSGDFDVTGAVRLECNGSPQTYYQGVTPGHDGFVLTPDECRALIAAAPESESVVFPYLIGRELKGDGLPERFVIDFGERTVLESRAFGGAFAHVEQHVLPDRQAKAKLNKSSPKHHQRFLESWWRLSWSRAAMKEAFVSLNGRFLAASRTQRLPFVYEFVSCEVLPGDKIQAFTFDDDYSFGIMQSGLHSKWYDALGSRLKNEVDVNYSTENVFETFPWPQAPTLSAVKKVAQRARDVREVRSKAMRNNSLGYRDVYATLSLPGKNPLRDAHLKLDRAVMAVYGFSERRDALEQLFELNGSVAQAIVEGELVTPPGLPNAFSGESTLFSSDCLNWPGFVNEET